MTLHITHKHKKHIKEFSGSWTYFHRLLSSEEASNLSHSHHNALVISILIVNCLIIPTLIDNESLTIVIFQHHEPLWVQRRRRHRHHHINPTGVLPKRLLLGPTFFENIMSYLVLNMMFWRIYYLPKTRL